MWRFMHFRKYHALEELRKMTKGFINLGAEIIILRLDAVAEIINDLRKKHR